jgi:hypothetical protein
MGQDKIHRLSVANTVTDFGVLENATFSVFIMSLLYEASNFGHDFFRGHVPIFESSVGMIETCRIL